MIDRMITPLAALSLLHTACYLDEDDFTARDYLVLAADDSAFHADGVSDCVVSATYPMGASPGQPLKITTTLPGGAPQTQMVVTAARDDPEDPPPEPGEKPLDVSPQELLRLRSSSQLGDALVVVDAGDWSQQIVCEATRAWPTSVALQSTVNTLESDGATSSDLTVTVRRTQDTGTPSVDTRVYMKACCATDDTATCAEWFNLPSVVSTAPAAPERISLGLPLSARGAAILNEKTDATHPAYEETRIFAVAVSEAQQFQANFHLPRQPRGDQRPTPRSAWRGPAQLRLAAMSQVPSARPPKPTAMPVAAVGGPGSSNALTTSSSGCSIPAHGAQAQGHPGQEPHSPHRVSKRDDQGAWPAKAESLTCLTGHPLDPRDDPEGSTPSMCRHSRYLGDDLAR